MAGKDATFEISNAGFLPIVSAYAARIGLIEQIDRLLHCQMEVSPGRVVLALILDALTGRSPLFRLEQFFQDKDAEHLLGEAIPRSRRRYPGPGLGSADGCGYQHSARSRGARSHEDL
jgi:hypothetical protein